MKNAVIIGAGQTGRGFIAPILKNNGYAITFLDKDEVLIKQLQEEGKYRIQYFGQAKEDCYIKEFCAFSMANEQAINKIMHADIVFTSVFASQIEELVPVLEKAIEKRVKKEMLQIICCENGVHVKKPLIDANVNAIITEGIIFCTTLKPSITSLDLLCEDYPEIPIDHVKCMNVHIEGMPLEASFDDLIQRKIYTYNFISAIVSYLGSYLSYEVYGEAANDPIITDVLLRIEPIITEVISQRYQVPYNQQLAFTRRAVSKFKNEEIHDTIHRNARQVERKLRVNERLFMPLLFANEGGSEQRYFEFMIVAALYYGESLEELDIDPILEQYQEKLLNALPIDKMRKLLVDFHSHLDLNLMLDNYMKEGQQ